MDDAITNAGTISLVTYRRDGTPVATPVWSVPVDGKLYVNTDTRSMKVRRLRRDARIRVAPCTMSGTPTGTYCDGTGRVVEDPALTARANRALRAKYGWRMGMGIVLGLVWRRFRERSILELAL
ncbi:MAG TPA: PPOX class F420-dependent oxidoreductase [bacterium]|nr:PPOX class F420-dependent oxidoreductase [bacterium]